MWHLRGPGIIRVPQLLAQSVEPGRAPRKEAESCDPAQAAGLSVQAADEGVGPGGNESGDRAMACPHAPLLVLVGAWPWATLCCAKPAGSAMCQLSPCPEKSVGLPRGKEKPIIQVSLEIIKLFFT